MIRTINNLLNQIPIIEIFNIVLIPQIKIFNLYFFNKIIISNKYKIMTK